MKLPDKVVLIADKIVHRLPQVRSIKVYLIKINQRPPAQIHLQTRLKKGIKSRISVQTVLRITLKTDWIRKTDINMEHIL